MQGSASCSNCTEMKGCSAKIFCITVLYVAGEERLLKYPLLKCILGIYNVSGQSTLQPAIVHSCPNETVIFTCYGRQAMNMEWIMEPYILEEDAKSFVAALAVNNRNIFTFTYTDFISSKLTNLTGYENKTADMTVTLTIQPIDEMNEANITCKVDDLLLFATLFIAGMWSMWSIVFRSILRCISPHKRGNHIPREGDIFHSSTRARRYV